jgi:hypothetical protein
LAGKWRWPNLDGEIDSLFHAMFKDTRHRQVAQDKKRTVCISRSSNAANQRLVTDLPLYRVVESACASVGWHCDQFVLPFLSFTEATFANIEYQLTRDQSGAFFDRPDIRTRFSEWTNTTLKNIIEKGWALDRIVRYSFDEICLHLARVNVRLTGKADSSRGLEFARGSPEMIKLAPN